HWLRLRLYRRGGCAVVADSRDARALRTAGRLNEPRPARVESNFDGTPWQVNHQPVSVLREEWRVLDRWWTEAPVVRRYFEVVLGRLDFRERETVLLGQPVAVAGRAHDRPRACRGPVGPERVVELRRQPVVLAAGPHTRRVQVQEPCILVTRVPEAVHEQRRRGDARAGRDPHGAVADPE